MSNIIEITDFNAPELDVYARISEVQLLNRAEPEKGIFIAESPKVIERALDAGCKPISFLVEHKHIEGEAKELIRRCGDIPVYTAAFDVLTQLTGFKLTRGMLCAMHRPALPEIEEVCGNARRIAVLENVVNPTNIGAIFRSAAALGMDAVLLTPGAAIRYIAVRSVSVWELYFRSPGHFLMKRQTGKQRESGNFRKWDLRRRLWP